ncbi:MAG TPA: DUF4390 domain-containing protein [Xanthomonadales bacterium]|nr:DUF4390 domain-containing protein [Xanthomonadales bacterium]
MAFITRSCAKLRDGHCWPTGLFLLLLAGCSPGKTDFGFTIDRVETRHGDDVLHIVVQQKLVLSEEAKQALTHGVPLVFLTRVVVRVSGSRGDLEEASKTFEIRYLPLSSRYQLSSFQPLRVHTFPRLRHALAELGSVDFTFAGMQLPQSGLELRVRSQLEKRRMPPPMRLPAWFSAQWRHDSGWSSWPLGAQSNT